LTDLVKTFNFTSDAEGWEATTGEPPGDPGFNPGVLAAWRAPHAGSVSRHYSAKNTNDPLKTMGGVLKTLARSYGTPQSENYWEWSGTWEDLGIPAGQTITSVSASYQWRTICWDGGRHQSQLEFGAFGVGSGPFQIRKSDGTLIGTTSARVYAHERNSSDFWRRWPQDPTSYGQWYQTEYPISVTPVTWSQVAGSAVAITGDEQASDSSIKLRLCNLTPETLNSANQWVRIKQDRIVVTVTYGAGAETADSLTLVLGF
jgi:hypothetical protein